MNSDSNSWTTRSLQSSLLFFVLGLAIAFTNSMKANAELEAQMLQAPSSFGLQTMAMNDHSQLLFQFGPAK